MRTEPPARVTIEESQLGEKPWAALPENLPYRVLCEAGAASRASAKEQAEAYARAGAMAVQDTWDAYPGEAAWKVIRQHLVKGEADV